MANSLQALVQRGISKEAQQSLSKVSSVSAGFFEQQMPEE
jgi:hypothetical protein